MRTNRITFAVVLSIALAVVSSAVAAQSTDEDLATPSYWTGTQTEGDGFFVDGPVGTIPGGFRTTVGLTYTAEASDPRAAGDAWLALVYDYTPSGMEYGVGPSRLVNEGGSWEGTAHATAYPDGSEFRIALMDGRDGYEGLTLTMTNYIDPSGGENVQGLIWKGDAAPLLDASVLPE
jgi:hypothetical protein